MMSQICRDHSSGHEGPNGHERAQIKSGQTADTMARCTSIAKPSTEADEESRNKEEVKGNLVQSQATSCSDVNEGGLVAADHPGIVPRLGGGGLAENVLQDSRLGRDGKEGEIG